MSNVIEVDARRPQSPSTWLARIWLAAALFGAFGAFGVVGCAARPAAAPASAGVPGWHRVRTEHFDLVTNLRAPLVLEAANALEQTRSALLRAAWSGLGGSTRQVQRTRVLVLADDFDFQHYFGPHIEAVEARRGFETLVLSGGPSHWERRRDLGDESTTSVLRHELVHQLAASIYGRQPRWFAEGLAQYLETVTTDSGGKTAIVGSPNLVALERYRKSRTVGVKDALEWSELQESDDVDRVSSLYGLSWAMVHWLINTQAPAFAAYQQALARGEDPAQAWSASFSGQSPDDMDRAIERYLNFGDYRIDRFALEPVQVEPVAATFSAADSHAQRAQLALVAADMDRKNQTFHQEAMAEWKQALALEPGNVAALRLAPFLDDAFPRRDMLARLHQQTERRPDDGEAWLLLGTLLDDLAEQEAALRKAVALLPGDARADASLAECLIKGGRANEALAFSIKATLLAPWDRSVLSVHAACLYALGRCADGRREEARALENAGEPGPGSHGTRATASAALQQYRRSCTTLTARPAVSPCALPADIVLSTRAGRVLLNGTDIQALSAGGPGPSALVAAVRSCLAEQHHYSFELESAASVESTRQLLQDTPTQAGRIEQLVFPHSAPIAVLRAARTQASGHWVRLSLEAQRIAVRELRRNPGQLTAAPTVADERELPNLSAAYGWLHSTCSKEPCAGLILVPSQEQTNTVLAAALRAILTPNAPTPLLELEKDGDSNELPQFGRLPPEVIQATVRAAYGEFRKCYEAGLARNASLQGRVLVKFEIDIDGSVRNSSLGSTLSDGEVTRCLLRSVSRLHFPSPEGGILTVVYPLVLAPD